MSGPFRLKLGLEIHAQLLSPQKLFSYAPPTFHAKPNSRVSYFDAALPGTQPRLSWACLNLAVRAGIALNSRIASFFSFDRKHYMYPDQPSGYQITQSREPIARGGFLDLFPRDYANMKKAPARKRINIQQIQMEQDTGKTSYVGDLSLVDLNRANTGLIELVTRPDFTSEDEAVAFIRKLQLLLRKLHICSGEMETGAMRVDVNVSVTDPEGRDLTERSEVKNLFSTYAVKHAVRVEFSRHCNELKRGGRVLQETRGWDGKKTWRLRSKENAMDYRYMPDPDLPRYSLPEDVVDRIRMSLPEYPDAILDKLTSHPYDVNVVDAKTLVDIDGGAEFCMAAVDEFLKRGGRKSSSKMVGTWLVHRWLGQSSKLPESLSQFVDIILAVDHGEVTSTTGRLLLKHVAQGYDGPMHKIIEEFGLNPQDGTESDELNLSEVVLEVVKAHPDVVARIRGGKINSVGFLLGQAMKETQGTFKPTAIRAELQKVIGF